MHLTDEELNEYLDNEGKDRAQVEAHLASCTNCARRFSALQALFDEIESLPEMALSRDLAAPVLRRVSGRAFLARSLRLTVILQFAAAVLGLVFAAPFVTQLLAPYLSHLRAPSLVDLFLQIQTQWLAWRDGLSQFQFPMFPELPVVELSGLVIILTVVGVSIFWLVGNGLLLRDQIE